MRLKPGQRQGDREIEEKGIYSRQGDIVDREIQETGRYRRQGDTGARRYRRQGDAGNRE
jgi:hypothetical protein